MRRANVQLQADRRVEILDAAQTLLCALGFHQTSMQEICAEAGMSPGNLYRYFRSKEDDHRRHRGARPRRGRRSSSPRSASGGFLRRPRGAGAASSGRAQHRGGRALRRDHGGEPPQSGRRAHLPGHRSGRPRALHRACCAARAERGEIRRDIDFDGTVTMLFALADGLSWRRAVEPYFDAEARVADRARHGRAHAAATRPRRRREYGEKCHESQLASPRSAWWSRPRRGSRPVICFRTRPRESRAAIRTAEAEAKAVPRRGDADAGRAAQPQARALGPHRSRPQDDGDARAPAACSPS